MWAAAKTGAARGRCAVRPTLARLAIPEAGEPMSERVFMMGNYAARFPCDRGYCVNHMWAQRRTTLTRFGFTAYAVRLLRDVYFLEWSVDENSWVNRQQQIGFIESKKAESDLYAPMAGLLVRFNPALLEDPSTINV